MRQIGTEVDDFGHENVNPGLINPKRLLKIGKAP
jgi:hypothetical protein